MTNEYNIPTTIDSAVLSTTLADYQKQLIDNVYNSNVVLKLFNQYKRIIDGGSSIVETLIKAKQDDGGFYLGADILNNTQKQTTTLVEYKWQNAYEPIQLTRDEERQNSGQQHKIIDLVGAKTIISERAMGDRLDQALSTPIGAANNLIDIDTLCSTGTLGTVAGATDVYWQANAVTSGAFASQGLTDMTTGFYAVSGSAMVDNPTHVLTNKTIFQKYEQTRLPLDRIAQTLTANAGFENLSFKGRPLIYGNYVASGLMYLLNMNYIYLAVDAATDMITTPFISPSNQTTKVAFILWRGNLITNNRRRHCRISSIT